MTFQLSHLNPLSIINMITTYLQLIIYITSFDKWKTPIEIETN